MFDPFHYLSQNNSKYPIQAIFWSMTSLPLRCFSKSGHFASRLKSSQDSGFSVKIGTVPPKSGRLDTLSLTRWAGAYAGGGGCTGCTCTPLPYLGKKFRSEMSKREEKVPPRYVGKKECARSAQIRQTVKTKKVGKKKENSKRKGLKLKK